MPLPVDDRPAAQLAHDRDSELAEFSRQLSRAQRRDSELGDSDYFAHIVDINEMLLGRGQS